MTYIPPNGLTPDQIYPGSHRSPVRPHGGASKCGFGPKRPSAVDHRSCRDRQDLDAADILAEDLPEFHGAKEGETENTHDNIQLSNS